MAEVIGPLTLLNKALPTGVDGTRVAEWALRDGVTWGEVVNTMALALAEANQEIIDKWGWLMFLTDEIMMEYENGGSVTAMRQLTDVDRPEPTHGTTIGHMLPLDYYGEAIGGSRLYWLNLRSAKLRASISTIVRKYRWRFEQKLLTRLFTNTENAIGSSGYDVPFVRGTGGNVDFAPPAFEGEAFTTSHDHYLGVNDDSLDADDQLNNMAETLQEHGHEPPFDAIVARADIATYAALTKFVEIVDIPGLLAIDRGGESSGNQMFQTGQRTMGHIGDFQSDYGLIRLHATARVPTLYAALVKSYGNLDERNSLAVRVHPDVGFGVQVVPQTTPDDDTPIQQLDIEAYFGISVGMDRTNGVASYLVSGGTWSNPTIS